MRIPRVKLFICGRKITIYGRGLSHVTCFQISEPHYTFGMVKGRSYHILNMTSFRRRTTKCTLKWEWSGSHDLNLKLETPFCWRPWTVCKPRYRPTSPNFYLNLYVWNGWSYALQNLYTNSLRQTLCLRIKNSPIMGVSWVSDPFYNFGTSSISSERLLKMETSYLVRILIATCICHLMINYH